MQSLEILQTISQVAAALAGFSGVVAAIGHRGSRAWTSEEILQLRTLVEPSLVGLTIAAHLLAAAGILRQFELVFVIGLILALAVAAYNFLLLLVITGQAE